MWFGSYKEKPNQWFLKISNYSEELLNGLDEIGDWPENVKSMQENWIGKSSGVQFNLKIDGTELDFDVFTTRPDTLFGMTFAVISPEHDLMNEILSISSNSNEIKNSILSRKPIALQKNQINTTAVKNLSSITRFLNEIEPTPSPGINFFEK